MLGWRTMRSKSASPGAKTLARRENGHAAFSPPVIAAFTYLCGGDATAARGRKHNQLQEENNPVTPRHLHLPQNLAQPTATLNNMANALEGCVTSLRSSMQLLDSSISILDTGVNDFPRMSKVLQATRVCYSILLATRKFIFYCKKQTTDNSLSTSN